MESIKIKNKSFVKKILKEIEVIDKIKTKLKSKIKTSKFKVIFDYDDLVLEL
jgi:hypothetical protein